MIKFAINVRSEPNKGMTSVWSTRSGIFIRRHSTLRSKVIMSVLCAWERVFSRTAGVDTF